MRALQARAVSRPPPRARDSTAATVGLGPLSSKEQKLSLILHMPRNDRQGLSSMLTWPDTDEERGYSSSHAPRVASRKRAEGEDMCVPAINATSS